ncbi:methyl-accepting chemotaxis protein [Desulfurispira natronophila]|uniref:Methyl-accepting chemotaxis protein n=1 Tax=Desulfurispira natronophila TaxID=682562 RepID=A0A7W7Y306_9BACT|nr:methyl-accepting chemotaxis protein [Desulfurispira natronophila]MBB5021094.1 methyl-accepting chemotaxis protein [Desulfurispira natronophila]
MQSLTLGRKILGSILAIGLLAMGGTFWYLERLGSQVEESVLADRSNFLQQSLQEQLTTKDDVGLTNALTIASSRDVVQALTTGDRQLAIDAMEGITGNLRDYSHYQNMRVHIHTADAKAFLRSWNPDHYGGDLQDFRHTINEVRRTQQPVVAFEVGRAGMTHRALAPVFDGGDYVGSLEIIQGMNSVAEALAENNRHMMMFMDADLLDIGTYMQSNPRVGELVLAQAEYNSDFMDDFERLGGESLIGSEYKSGRQFFFTHAPVLDYQGNVVGHFVVGEPLRAVMAAVDASQAIIRVSQAIVGGLIVVFLVVMGLMLHRMVISKMNNLCSMVEDISTGNGDLTKRLEVTSRDEIGVLSQHFNVFVDKIHDIVFDVKTSAYSVASGTAQLSATTEQFSATFNEQAAQVSGVASALEEMDASSLEVKNNVELSQDKSRHAMSQTRQGQDMLASAVASIGAIQQQTDRLSTDIQSLTEMTGEITQVLEVINDISEQTNLLALNAAIEAARAGDAGRGFAVVADEVRKLAEKTQESVGDIEQIINNVKQQANSISSGMKSTESKVLEGSQAMERTDETFVHIVSAVEDIVESNEAIASAVEQQYQAIRDISSNVQMIASGVEESSSVVSEVAHTVTDLQTQAESLQLLTDRFVINEKQVDQQLLLSRQQ